MASVGGKYEGQTAKATVAVERSFARAAKQPLGKTLFQAGGEKESAGALKGLQITRVGKGVTGDPELVAKATHRIYASAALAYSDDAKTAYDVVEPKIPAVEDAKNATTFKLNLGTGW